jgi:hypothetical protein
MNQLLLQLLIGMKNRRFVGHPDVGRFTTV